MPIIRKNELIGVASWRAGLIAKRYGATASRVISDAIHGDLRAVWGKKKSTIYTSTEEILAYERRNNITPKYPQWATH